MSRSICALTWSGWPDSNRRPLAPKASALAKLRHSPLHAMVAEMTARPVWTLRHSASGRRSRLICERWCLAASLRSRAARLGPVGRRGGGGGAVAAVRIADILVAAACRLRNWERCSEAATVRTPSVSRPASARSARSFAVGGRAEVPARSKDSSTLLSAVLTDWPPGPGDLEKRHVSSAGDRTVPRTWTGNVTIPGWGREGAAAAFWLG